jgi:putative ABC transport system permease protein
VIRNRGACWWRSGYWVTTMFLQVRRAFHSLRRAPLLTAISVATVALGVGAGTALFSVVKAVLLNPLPYRDPGRLVWIAPLGEERHEVRASLPDFDDWHEQNSSFAHLAAYADAPFLASGSRHPERVQGAMVTEEFFDVLGMVPMSGRVFSPQEHQTGAPLGLVVIGHGLWQRVYGGDPEILGRRISLIGLDATVIGVMPAGFSYPTGTDLWVATRSLVGGSVRLAPNFRVIGRLTPQATIESAREDMEAIVAQLKQQYASPLQPAEVALTPLASHLTGSVRIPVLILFASVGLLLLIICANVANLLLVRLAARSRELAVRTALGAGRRRLFQDLIMESLLLAVAGGGLGILLASLSMDLLRLVIPASVPRAAEVRMDLGVMTFAFTLSALVGALMGTLPSWRATRVNIYDALKAAPRGQSGTRHSLRLQSALLISEVALSLVLIAAAGLLLSSFSRLSAVEPGFRSERVLAASLSFPMNAAERGRITARYREILERARALPGVEWAGLIRDLPFSPVERDSHFTVEGGGELTASIARWQIVSPGLMQALRIPLLRGRRFTEGDTESAPGVAIISQAMARRYWRGRDPIGDRVWFDGTEPKEHWLTIVGVAGDVLESGLTQPAPPIAYVCYSQLQMPGYLSSATVVVRSEMDANNIVPPLRKLIRQVHPGVAVTFRAMDDVLADATARQRFQMQVLTGFAMLALVLGIVGFYGVMSYTVASNRMAIGIRMALGARPVDVFRSVMWRGLVLTGAGSAIGLVGCLAFRSILSKVVFGVGPSEPTVLAGATLAMLGVALAASWAPASRAMRAAPAKVLRGE